jgi:hypothetical protein
MLPLGALASRCLDCATSYVFSSPVLGGYSWSGTISASCRTWCSRPTRASHTRRSSGTFQRSTNPPPPPPLLVFCTPPPPLPPLTITAHAHTQMPRFASSTKQSATGRAQPAATAVAALGARRYSHPVRVATDLIRSIRLAPASADGDDPASRHDDGRSARPVRDRQLRCAERDEAGDGRRRLGLDEPAALRVLRGGGDGIQEDVAARTRGGRRGATLGPVPH